MTFDELKMELRKYGGYRRTLSNGMRAFGTDKMDVEDRARAAAMFEVAFDCFFREITGETIPNDLTKEIEDAQNRN